MVQAKMTGKTLQMAQAQALALALSLLAGGAAQAESNPYYLGGSLGVNRVSNVYRESNADNSDTVTTVSLLAGIDQQIGRQHLVIDGSLRQSRYAVNTPLNNHGYSLRGVLDWATIERISGSFSASANQQLANYNISNSVQPVRDKKNIARDQQLQAVVRVGLVTRYSLEGSLTHFNQDYSLAEYDALVFHQNAASLGLVFRPSDLLRLGVALRHTVGEYPRYPALIRSTPCETGAEEGTCGMAPYLLPTPDKFKRDDLDLTGNWTASGASRFDARLSWTNAVHDDIAASLNYKGVTGSIAWYWQPVSRFTLTTRYIRDTGNQANILGPSQNRVGNALELSASYQLTSKVALTASTSQRRSLYRTDDGTGTEGHSNDRNYSVGSSWAYSRSLSVSCQAYRTGRDSSVSSNNFNATGYGCTLQGLMY